MARGFRITWFAGRALLAAFALLALAMRVAAPSGYMLAPSGDGARFLTVELCAGQGNAVRLDLKTGRIVPANDAPDDHAQKHEPCAFAATAHVAPSESAPSLSAPVGVFVVAETLAENDMMPGRGLAAPPPWATGPPARV